MEYQEILNLTYELKDDLKNSNLYKDMINKEKEMIDDHETFILLNKYQIAQNEYNQALRFKDYDDTYKIKQIKLFEIKKTVDVNIYVKEYNLSYNKFIKQLKEIENEVFKDIIIKKKGNSLCG